MGFKENGLKLELDSSEVSLYFQKDLSGRLGCILFHRDAFLCNTDKFWLSLVSNEYKYN